MKIPDKVYISFWKLNRVHNGFAAAVSFEPEKGFDKEYINKKALMKWIQEVRSIPHENAITRDLAFQEIINKLNSM